ncbi:MAG: hypothetical protein HC828_05670 [Blastochloris sp.]|nr:hypothetical protein [Blastochloris sp.]
MKRRKHTMEKEIRLTHGAYDAITAYATRNNLSFSAAIETLARLGMDQPLSEAVAPAVVSTVRSEIARHYDRIIRLVIYGLIETGVTQRLTGAILYARYKELGQVEVYTGLKPRRGLTPGAG